MKPQTGAQFEISIDGTLRTYRDTKEIALEAARVLKSRNPNSEVKVRELGADDNGSAGADSVSKLIEKDGRTGNRNRCDLTHARSAEGVVTGAGAGQYPAQLLPQQLVGWVTCPDSSDHR